MDLLVTGGLGFIGSNYVIQTLTSNNDVNKITVVDNLSYGSNPSNLNFRDDKRYKFIKGDITDFRLIGKLISEVDAVVNFAANTHVDRSIADPSPFFKSNTEGLFTILEAIRRSNRTIRLLQVSTDEVYGDITKGSFKEEDVLRPSSPYASSKAAADLFCLAYHRTYGMDVVISRCTNNFGPYQFPEKLIPKTILRANLGLKVPIYGFGKNVRDWIYVIDHCDALDIILKGGRSGEIYNVSSGNELDNLAIVKKILDILGKAHDFIEFVEDRPGHDLRYTLDSSKVRRTLNWRPKHDLDLALKKTVEWYLSNERWWRPLIDKKILSPKPWKLRW